MPSVNAMKPRVAILSPILLLAACAAGPDFAKPAVVPPAEAIEAWPVEKDEPLLSWSSLSDPTLDELQRRAMAANQDVQASLLRLAQSRAERTMTAAQRAPAVGASAGANRQRLSEDGASMRMIEILQPPDSEELIKALSEPYDLFQAGFDASWELDLWGRVRRSVEAADAQVIASQATLGEVRLGIQAEVARRYFELRTTERQIELAKTDIAASEETLELVDARAEGGLTSDLDVRRQAAQLAALRAQLPQLLAQEARLHNQLTLLTGESPGALDALLASPSGDAFTKASLDRALPDLSLGVPSEVAQRRPDIQRAEAQLHAATASIGIASAELYPRIVLGGDFGYEAVDADRFGEWGSRQWTVGASLDLPIFDMGRRRSMVTLRRLQQQEAAVEFQRTVLRAWHEIDDALTDYDAERRRHVELAAREANSRDAYELARARYENGLTDFLIQLDAQRTLIAAQRDYAESTGRLATGLVAISKALGVAVE